MDFEAITEKIIGCAYEVYNTMGFGYLESVYEKCLMFELNNAGLNAVSQSPVKVNYKGGNVGDYIADVIVENSIILELKSAKSISDAHKVQLVNYLTATGLKVGLIINFGPNKVEICRRDLTYFEGV